MCPLSPSPDNPSCCPDRCPILQSLSSPSPLASQTDACLAHCCPANHKRGFTLPSGAGNFRWIILGPGKPVFNRTSLNLATLNHVSLCVDWVCMCDSPGQVIVRYVQYFHLGSSALKREGKQKIIKVLH